MSLLTIFLTELLERVKGLTGPDPEVDALLWGLVDDRPLERIVDDLWGKRDPNDSVAFDTAPNYTESLDAAERFRMAVLPNSTLSVIYQPGFPYFEVWVDGPDGYGCDASEPIARIAAALGALKALK